MPPPTTDFFAGEFQGMDVMVKDSSRLAKIKGWSSTESNRVDAEHNLFHCYKEMNLVRVGTGMAKKPEEYLWSSYVCHAWDRGNDLITEHDLYLSLDQTDIERQHAHGELFRADLSGNGFLVVC